MISPDFTEKYLEILNGPLKGLNLTRITNPVDFKLKQVDDSLLPLYANNMFSNIISNSQLIVDIGFGGGFPILPLAEALPSLKLIGLEARAKKAKAVQLIADEMGIKNVTTFHQRLEDVLIDRECLLTFKAVSTIKDCLSKINSSKKVYVLFYKAMRLKELEPGYEKIDGWKLLSEYVKDSNNLTRHLVLYENVPRGTSQKFKKNLVKLSCMPLN